jgi:hypothetical protein
LRPLLRWPDRQQAALAFDHDIADAALRVHRLWPFARLCLLPFEFFDLAPLQLKDAVAFHLIICCRNAGARLARLSYVEPRVITVVGSAISSRMILIGFGVVVTTTRGSDPSRSPNISRAGPARPAAAAEG